MACSATARRSRLCSMNYTQPEKDSIAIWLREGDSASQIAPKLSAQRGSPVTRNAIIGVVHRDKALAAIGFDRDRRLEYRAEAA
jgi:hypothetical protein